MMIATIMITIMDIKTGTITTTTAIITITIDSTTTIANRSRDWYQHHHDAFRVKEGRYWHREWEPRDSRGICFYA